MVIGTESAADGHGPAGTPEAAGRPAPSRFARMRAKLPRPETIILVLSLLGTIVAKLVAVRRNAPEEVAAGVVHAATFDVAFFAGTAALLALVHAARPGRLAGRVALGLAAIVGLWSFINAAVLYDTNHQIFTGMAVKGVTDLTTSWGIVATTIAKNPPKFLPAIAFGAAMVGWIAFRLVRPAGAPVRRRRALAAAAAAAVACAAAIGLGPATKSSATSIWSDAVGFSSHWLALRHVAADVAEDDAPPADARVVPRAGERAIVPPPAPPAEAPNVVVILLESVAYEATSFADPALETTPVLRRLAGEGIEFASTHVHVPYTTKAHWAAFTGTRPDLRDDAPESVLVDVPYESLATILEPRGYRSAFFETARGAFEGAPALFANLGFDYAWFRENLEDPSAYIGWIGADDMRMVGPMFQWVDAAPGPFLLGVTTSITHDPYDLPPWFDEPPAPDKHGRYLQTIRCSDAFVGAVVAELEKRGILDRTLICVLGDHGEIFRPEAPRGRLAPFEEALRIPWVIRWPEGVAPGQRTSWPCLQVDVTPTILALLGFGIDGAGFEGRNATAPGPADRRLFFNCWYRKGPHGYREGDVKLVYYPYTDVLYRYDLARDPKETAPERIDDEAVRRSVIDAVRAWERASYLEFPPQRYRERLLFGHWQALSTGRRTTAYYVPDPDAS